MRVLAEGLCVKHYTRLRRHGDPEATSRPNYGKGFWSYVDRSGECWLWTGTKSVQGYGQLRVDGHLVQAHRYSYEQVNGSISEGLQINHHCDIPTCVRPEHLYAGTHADNVRDRSERGRTWNGQRFKTRCPQGHLYDEENTYWYKGERSCRECRREAARRYKKRVRGG